MNYRRPADSQSSKPPHSEDPNGSEWEGRSYYSDAKHRVLFRFEEKNQYYVEEGESPRSNKPGFITHSRVALAEERWDRPKQLS